MSSLQKRATFLFYQIIGISIVFLAIVLYFVINLYSKLVLVGRSFLGKLESICGCTNYFTFVNHPIIFTLVIGASLGLMIVLSLVIIKIYRFRGRTVKFVKANLENRKSQLSRRLRAIVKEIGLDGQIIEIDNLEPVIFCYGFRKPKICISSGLVKRLSHSELRAVLLHERHHLLVYEPLKIFLVKLASQILFFIPGFKRLTQQYFTFSELTADQQATNNFANREPLARALYKVIRWQESYLLEKSLALSFLGNITEERINTLTRRDYQPALKIVPILSIFLGLGILLVTLLNISFFSHKTIMLNHQSGLCPLSNNNINHQCQFSAKKATCDIDNYVSWEKCEYM